MRERSPTRRRAVVQKKRLVGRNLRLGPGGSGSPKAESVKSDSLTGIVRERSKSVACTTSNGVIPFEEECDRMTDVTRGKPSGSIE